MTRDQKGERRGSRWGPGPDSGKDANGGLRARGWGGALQRTPGLHASSPSDQGTRWIYCHCLLLAGPVRAPGSEGQSFSHSPAPCSGHHLLTSPGQPKTQSCTGRSHFSGCSLIPAPPRSVPTAQRTEGPGPERGLLRPLQAARGLGRPPMSQPSPTMARDSPHRWATSLSPSPGPGLLRHRLPPLLQRTNRTKTQGWKTAGREPNT